MEHKNTLYFILDILVNAVIIIALALFIRTFLISPFHVFGPSMCNTINEIDGQCIDSYGEYIIVNELTYQNFFGTSIGDPEYLDIVIFKPPGNEDQYYVKRIIGMPGDKIKIDGGFVYRWENGEFVKLDESEYLSEDALGNTLVTNSPVVYDVPEDKYFVLGDNRTRSTDSRHCFRTAFPSRCSADHENTYITKDMMRGKAWVVFWPLQNFRVLD